MRDEPEAGTMRDATDLGLCTKLVVDLPFVRTAGTVKAAMAIGRLI
jgi:hypothetical protein